MTTWQFHKELADLDALLIELTPIGTDLATAVTALTRFDGALTGIEGINKALKDIKVLLSVLDAGVDALTPVPLIGEIADSFSAGVLDPTITVVSDFSRTFNSLDKSVVKPVRTVVNDLKKGLGDIQDVVTTLTTTVPRVVNTVNVLGYLLEIANALVPMLNGSAAGLRLARAIAELAKVESAVGSALHALHAVVTPVAKPIKDVASALDDAWTDIGPSGQKAIHTLTNIAHTFHPLTHAFDSIEKSVAPVKWAFEAISAIINAVVMPVVNWLLTQLHLDKILALATAAIKKSLGFDALTTGLGKVSPATVGKHAAVLGASAGGTFTSLSATFSSALGQYESGSNAPLQAELDKLISAVVGATINTKGGAVPTPMPSIPPALTGVPTKAPSAALARISGPEPLSARQEMPPERDLVGRHGHKHRPRGRLPSVDPVRWPASAALIKQVATVSATLATLEAATAAFAAATREFDSSLVLPDEYAAELASMDALLDIASSACGLVASLKLTVLDPIEKPIEAVVAAQISDMKLVKTEMPALQAAVAALGTAAAKTIASVPALSVVGAAKRRFTGWDLGVRQLTASVELDYRAAKKHHPADVPTLDAQRAHVEAAATAAAARLVKATAACSKIDAALAGLTGVIDGYAVSLAAVSAHTTVIGPKVLPSLQHASGLLHTVGSIMDPLAGLLQAGICTDPTNKVAANTSLTLMKSAAATATTPSKGLVSAIVSQFDSGVLPLGKLAADVKAAATSINGTAVASFSAHANSLDAALVVLTAELQTTHSYQCVLTKGGKPQTVDNDFVDQNFADTARRLAAAHHLALAELEPPSVPPTPPPTGLQ